MHSEAEARQLLEKLRWYELRRLKHIYVVCLFGWENFDEDAETLSSLGLIDGRWSGSLGAPARPMWTTTSLGDAVLRLDAKREAEPSPSGTSSAR